jgi:putative aldouronate transport system substrate-binding protein
MKRFNLLFSALCVTVLILLFISAGGQERSGDTEIAGKTITEGVTGKVAVEVQYGDKEEYPLSATGWTANPQYPSQPPISGRGEYPIVRDKVTLRVAMPDHPNVLDFDDNDATKFMENLTNVHVQWELLPQSGAREKINLIFAAGDDLPDVVMSGAFSSADLISFGSAKLIIPLQDLVERNGYYIKKRYDEHPTAYSLARSADGNSYSLVDYTFNEANQVSMRFWINKTFMDRLGFKIPATTDELYEYLKAVKTKDPNGNGKADEIPLIGSSILGTGWHQEIDGFLMNAFIFNESGTGSNRLNRRRVFLKDDGTVDSSFNKPEWRDGLAYLHKLCAEGLLAPESFTITAQELRSLVENPDASIVGSLPAGSPHEFARPDGERRKDFLVVPPLKGPKGVQQTYFDEYQPFRLGMFVVTKDCEIPDIAIKWADYMYTMDWHTRNRYGVRGRDWDVPVGQTGVYGGPAIYEETGLKWGTPTRAYWVNALRWNYGWGSYMRPISPDPYELEYVLYQAKLKYDPYKFSKSLPRNLAFTLQEARRYSELTNLIVDYVDQSLAAFVTGRLDLNRDWDRYIANLNSMGLEEWLKLTQAGYDRGWKK